MIDRKQQCSRRQHERTPRQRNGRSGSAWAKTGFLRPDSDDTGKDPPPPTVVRCIIRYLNQLAAVPCGLQHSTVPTVLYLRYMHLSCRAPGANCRKAGNQSSHYGWDAFSGFVAPRAQKQITSLSSHERNYPTLYGMVSCLSSGFGETLGSPIERQTKGPEAWF